MKPTPRRITALWKNNPGWRASLKDIRDAFGSGKAQMPKLKSLLEDLVTREQLTYERHRYQIARRAAPPDKTRHKEKLTPARPQLAGIYSAHPDGYGFVDLEMAEQSAFIPPRKEGGALDGDSVQIVMEKRRGSDRTSGKVIAVSKRGRTTVRGVVHVEQREQWLLPLNVKLPMIFLEAGQAKVKFATGDLVEVEFLTYPSDSRTAPSGRVLSVLPSPDTPEQIIDNILADIQIPTAFSEQTLREMATLDSADAPRGGGGREDLTELPFVTIDGADARDFDDAVCLTKGSGGGCRLLVAIADVAHYVRPGSAVDKDAYDRGTSVYFPERVVPMLPEVLSNELCSLKPDVPRLALVCEMNLDAKGMRKDYRIFEALIRSHARLTYAQVQSYLDSGNISLLDRGAPHGPMLADMLAFSEKLAASRSRRGALGFEFPEARFIFSASGIPAAIDQALPTQSTRLIEQFMLEANETVAWHCETNEIPILYRVHDPPPADQMAQLRIQLVNFGVTVSDKEFGSSKAINTLLSRLADHPARDEIELIILKSMSQAQYRSKNDGHFGLAATHYAHFTSPIRRYPDLVVHRALKMTESGGRTPAAALKNAVPAEAGPLLSMYERRAGEAESQVSRLYRVLYMEQFLGQEFDATVSGVSAKGLRVRPRDYFVEGFLPMALLPDDQYRFDAQRSLLRSSRRKRTISFGQRLTVKLLRTERLTQELEFGFCGWDWKDGESGVNSA